MSAQDARLEAIDRNAQLAAARVSGAVSGGMRKVVGSGAVDSGVAVVSNLNAKAEAAAAVAHAHGVNYGKRIGAVCNFCTSLVGHYAALTWFFSLLAFCFAAGLLSYTENNKDPRHGFGPQHTAWREALTIIILLSSLLSWHAIFLRHSTMLQFMGYIHSYCACAMFVVASFDTEAAAAYCLQNPAACTASLGTVNGTAIANQFYDPTVQGNLWPAPYLDYTVFILWLFVGNVLIQRGRAIDAVVENQQREAQVLSDLAKSVGAPVSGEAYNEAVPVQVSGNY